ncbi:Protein O-mannosyltransferase 2 [Linnemannia schmuckeri]|uniref:Dolichyl-phosphate-mannose--protein mannosyltransferase n=1 Tax=Linnemannia schmuckeri TaxID=64567 RepID=A0A9P5RTJ6_9FUNG|nr:Protein O-mannosyltransferase 2 [Linnemannia schmuckeri]
MTSELRYRYIQQTTHMVEKEGITTTWTSSSLTEIDDDYPVKPYKLHLQGLHQQQLASLNAENSDGGKKKLARIVEACSSTVLTLVLTGLSAWTRYRDILSTNNVAWNEAHFGKFGSFYIRGERFFDVHPSLAKMLVGLSGILAAYDGSFNFESGVNYPDINYRFMRLFNATFGVVMVLLAFWTARELHMSRTASTFAAAMVLMDNAYLVINRYILLDSMLLSSICFVVLCLTKFRNLKDRPFLAKWWMWLSMMGVGIGAVSSMKWVGLLVTALVGLCTVEDLWDLLGDLHMSMATYVMHWVARTILLIALSITIYISRFIAHFYIPSNSGPGDAYMPSLFQANLNGADFSKNSLEVAYGSLVTIKSSSHGGGLLHSHIQAYPQGSKQQQVMTYHHKDNNNDWILTRSRNPATPHLNNPPNNNNEHLQILKSGDNVRLVHESTGRNLHTHRIRAPVTTAQLEVSGYKYWNQGDGYDEWVLEVVGGDSRLPQDGTLRSLTTKFVLRHRILGCLLTSGMMPLPEWGFKQVEVYCDQSVPALKPMQYKSNFWRDFIHLNVAMMKSNNGLTQDPDKDDHLASLPSQWPFLAIGLRMNRWFDNKIKIYLLGNPIVWWSGTVSLGVFVATLAYYNVVRGRQQQRLLEQEQQQQQQEEEEEQQQENDGDDAQGYQTLQSQPSTSSTSNKMSDQEWDRFKFIGKVTFDGWILYYLPSLIKGHVMYLHHYFPALYFTTLHAFLIDHFLARLAQHRLFVKTLVWGVAFAAVTLTFIWFWPASYGIHGPAGDTMKNRQ